MVMTKRIGMLAVLAGAAMALGSVAAQAQTAKPNFRLCTGGDKGNYYRVGKILEKRTSAVNVQVIPTDGSLDNLNKIVRNECDGAFVQSDSLLVFSAKNADAISTIERSGVLYPEYVHLVCNRNSGIERITDLKKNHRIAIGSEGTGANTTWAAFVQADPKRYKEVGTDDRSENRAIAAVSDGSEVQCSLFVAGLGSSYMKTTVSNSGKNVVLVGTDDWDMGKVAKDGRGKSVYNYMEIPAGTYPKIQPSGMAWGTKPVKVITVDALFVGNLNWIKANSKAFNGVLEGMDNVKTDAEFKKIAEPQ